MPRGKGVVTRRLGLSRSVFGAAERVLALRNVETVRVSPTANVRIHRPRDPIHPAPAVLWIHGGGYVLGSARVEDRKCRRMATSLGAVVAAVDYRLAPESPYPAALDDCYAALEWLVANPGIDRRRIVVAGVSAGGGLSAALTLRCVDTGLVNLAGQVLQYPMLDDRTALKSTSVLGWTTSPACPRRGSASGRRTCFTIRMSISRLAFRRRECPRNSRSSAGPFTGSTSPRETSSPTLSKRRDWRRSAAFSARPG